MKRTALQPVAGNRAFKRFQSLAPAKPKPKPNTGGPSSLSSSTTKSYAAEVPAPELERAVPSQPRPHNAPRAFVRPTGAHGVGSAAADTSSVSSSSTGLRAAFSVMVCATGRMRSRCVSVFVACLRLFHHEHNHRFSLLLPTSQCAVLQARAQEAQGVHGRRARHGRKRH